MVERKSRKAAGKRKAEEPVEVSSPPTKLAKADASADEVATLAQHSTESEDSPPPLPDEPPPLPDEPLPGADDEDEAPPLPDEPLPEDGGADAEGADEEEDNEAPPLPDEEPPEAGTGGAQGSSHSWQAIWDPTRAAYYFWNSQTQETTWINPLQSSADEPAAGTAAAEGSNGPEKEVQPTKDELFEQQTGIDADLAFLDPALAASMASSSGGPAGPYSAKGFFDARKGKFVPHSEAAVGSGGTYDPSRMTYAAQANRQMQVFFDTDAWQRELEERRRREAEEGGKAPQRVTKQDIQRFKQKKKEKKAARYGWLRD